MTSTDTQLERFVRAVHRRQVVLRVVERAGVGLLAGCGVAVPLVPVLLWRGQDAWGFAAVAMGLGALAGAAWGVARRPAALAAAAEADRQLDTADLLATAWALHSARDERVTTDAWRHTVLALAATRCAALSPSAVLLRRLGGRAWGGIGLAVALVATLASFSSDSVQGGSVNSQSAATTVRRSAGTEAARPIIDLSAADRSGPQRRREQNPGEGKERGHTPLDPSPAEAAGAESAPSDPSSEMSRQTGAAGGADGSGRTKSEAGAREEAPLTPGSAKSIPRGSGGDHPSGGAGRAATGGKEGPADGSAGGTVAQDEDAAQSPPWSHPSWSAAAEAAGEAVRAGRVPDAYHDLIRGYFDRPSASDSERGR